MAGRKMMLAHDASAGATANARLGVVLAGGLATRMGGDKAGALLAGTPLLERAIATVRAAGLHARVCVRAQTPLPPLVLLDPEHVWREPQAPAESAHPLAGLAQALERAGEPLVALPVDLPLLPPLVLAALAARPEPLVMVGIDGRPAALVLRASPEHAPTLAQAAQDGSPALRTLVGLGAAVVDLADLVPGIDPREALTNVNGPAELAALEGRLA